MKIKYFLSAIASLIFSLVASAQSLANYQGSWQGILNVSGGVQIVFHVKDNGHNGLIATADSPDQSAFGLKCDTTWVAAGLLTIEMYQLKASYTAKLVGDSVLDGTFKQGAEFPLVLKKTASTPVARKRPQEPKAPFPYKSEEVEYDNTSLGLHYGATITIPPGKGPFPAVLLITGSGPQNRDEEIMGHKPFAVLADALTRNGFVVLRVDDRGVGKSSGQFGNATSADFADDARTSLRYLLSRPEVDRKKTGLIGHSEGGMIAPMVAASSKDVDFIILLAGPGIKIDSLMAEQNAAILRKAGVSPGATNAYLTLYKAACKTVLSTNDSTAAILKVKDQVDQWAKSTDTTVLNELGLSSAETHEKIASTLVKELQGKWYRYFLAFDPTPYLEALHCKVLALNGEKDIQVIARSNLAGIESALKKSKSKTYTVKELPGLNHLFQTCKTCTVPEYERLEETFSPTALEEINNWLNKNVK